MGIYYYDVKEVLYFACDKFTKEYSNSTLSLEELSKEIDLKLKKFLLEKKFVEFSKKDLATLINFTTKELDRVIAKLPEEIQFKNNRGVLTYTPVVHFFLTPFIISKIKEIDLKKLILEISKF